MFQWFNSYLSLNELIFKLNQTLKYLWRVILFRRFLLCWVVVNFKVSFISNWGEYTNCIPFFKYRIHSELLWLRYETKIEDSKAIVQFFLFSSVQESTSSIFTNVKKNKKWILYRRPSNHVYFRNLLEENSENIKEMFKVGFITHN